MTKLEFMKELESLLSDIPFEERNEALQYYNGYFEDAGEENEDEIIKELGSPKRVASIIKADLNSNAQDRENRGYFTEKGYEDTSIEEDRFDLVGSGRKNANSSTGNSSYHGSTSNSNASYSNAYNYTNSDSTSDRSSYSDSANHNTTGQRRNGTNVGLIILACIFGFPFISAAFGIIVGILSAILGIIVGFGAAGIAMIAAGIALIVAGLIQISVPLIALIFCGSGLLVLGIGMLFGIATVALCKKVLPAMIRGIVNLCRRPFQNRSVAA